jgi:16S rRNA (uracil1498-N3)-methyltransferase
VAREARRLLITPERLAQAAPLVPLDRHECHYLQRVLRLRLGDRFAVVDGAGRLWPAAVEPQAARLLLPLDQPAAALPPPQPRLQLAVALPRQGSDVLLRMVCELGIDRIQPLLAERSVQERWNPQRAVAILREALEQCERLWLPELGQPETAAPWLAAADGLRLIATTRRPEALPLVDALAATTAAQCWRVSVAIGPEGGWSPDEEAQAIAAGWQPVSLTATILRTSTAAVAATAALCSWRR